MQIKFSSTRDKMNSSQNNSGGPKDKPSSTLFKWSRSTEKISGNKEGPTHTTLLSKSGSAHSTISGAGKGSRQGVS